MLCVWLAYFSPRLGVASHRTSSPKAKKLGRNIARLRTSLKLTQESLAERAGISTRYIQDLEAGMYEPTIFVTDAIRQAVSCEWSDLLEGC
jgi:transcriptional regulator with XRE-family HTH domain